MNRVINCKLVFGDMQNSRKSTYTHLYEYQLCLVNMKKKMSKKAQKPRIIS